MAAMRAPVIVLLAYGPLLPACCVHAVMNVINKSPPDGKIVKAGRDVNLSCRTDNRWFFCIWNSPSGNKQCAIQENTPQNVCSGDPRIMLMGGLNNCEIHLRNVGPQDHGQWTCMVTDPVKFDNDKETISLEVGQRARVGFDPGFGNKNELRMTEGDSMEVRKNIFKNRVFC